ncbi:MAG: CHASE2 domain-containing protein [Cyclobacteriaceae bacterium]|nr:CHASE2 domain-containing protein [Cyclobacteriaceae bacterium]
MKKRGILADSLLGTFFILSLILFFQAVRLFGEFKLLDPIGDAIGDVELTDLVFSNIRPEARVDTSIVLVNIGQLSRAGIARELQVINKYQPAVIGIDSYFWDLKEDSLGDLALSAALSDIENLVLVNKLQYNPMTGSYDSVRYSHERFNVGKTGFANLETDALAQYQYKVCRTFPPKRIVKGNEQYSFALTIASLYDESAAKKCLNRHNESEVINYRGNIMGYGQSTSSGRFAALDVSDVLSENFEPSLVKGKIVLFGYLGSDFNDKSWEDKFYTPLNVNYAGRSNPDMFGIVVHANIISMILSRDYITKQSDTAGYITAVIICFLVVLLFTLIYKRLPQWYDGVTKSLQIVFVMLLLTINVFVFHWFNYKVNLTLATIMVALAGDSLEVCFGLVKNLFSNTGRKLIFKVYN